MLKNQFFFALRALFKNRSWLVINITGFSIAFAATLLIFSWASFELSYDKCYKNRDRIFRILEKQNYKGEDEHYLAQIPEYLDNAFEKDIPEIEASACLLRTNNLRIKSTNETIEIDNILYAGTRVFDIFGFDFIEGSPENTLDEPFSVVLTESTARKLFENRGPALGKTLEMENNKIYTVKGVIKDIPPNSHLQFNALLSLNERKPGWNYQNGNHNASCYILLKPNTGVNSLESKLQTVLKSFLPRNADYLSWQLQPLKDIHLDSMFTMWEINWNKFDRKYVNAFIIVAFLIIFIVISNYINLTLACSTKRNVEVALKKIAGSNRQTLITQFFLETSIIIIISLVAAIFIFENSVPFLQKTILKGYNFNYSVSSLRFYAALLIIISIIELAGIYPAVIFTSFSPVSVLKNNFTGQIKGSGIRKTLTVFQFAISIVLIISLIIIVKQVNYLKTKDLGYNKENVLQISANSYIRDHYDQIRADLLNNPLILDVTFTNTRLSSSMWRNSIDFEDKPAGTRWEMPYMAVDYNFFDFYNIPIVKGRDFSPDLALDKQGTAFIVNESLAKKLGYDDPVGKKFRNGETHWGEIVGVVRDFNFSSLHDAIEPILFYPSRIYLNELSIKVSGADIPRAVRYLQSKWVVYNPGHEFRYSFLDRTIEQFYTKEEDARSLIMVFSAISLFLSVIGLFGMVSYQVKKRTKEIGIRKINGAKISEVLIMLNTDFIKWISIAFIVAVPAAWFIMGKWLQGFAFRISVCWWIFALAGMLALSVALFTINLQTLKTARKNPVDSLRYE